MANMIPVPRLEGAVWVHVTATFGAGSDAMAIAFPANQYGVSAQLKEPKKQSRLEIKADIVFPQYFEGFLVRPSYRQIVTGSFDNIAEVDGNHQFSNTDTDLEANLLTLRGRLPIRHKALYDTPSSPCNPCASTLQTG